MKPGEERNVGFSGTIVISKSMESGIFDAPHSFQPDAEALLPVRATWECGYFAVSNERVSKGLLTMNVSPANDLPKLEQENFLPYNAKQRDY